MVAIRRNTSTMAFVKKVCKEIEQPFTVFDLMRGMHGKRRNYPTIPELQHSLTKMDFIEVVGKDMRYNGTTTQYQYVGD